ncbi:thioredoxin fold domain-containing protein [Chromobacterium sp. IIBBL 290-4]|uniref:thioredoxin fold domain-containing protein n=1 Tax=Chromobacterium sp. IIBBL 290-4 TaxID=2953890 RepID=UPI0020B877EE|nr:thioredoxin fold domain-containing protein [Chromobacterium sp. IIBBL 290-4]UTH74249.1 thioredoxin fold domain-containing protein [Chromobacterium sp. IIBBL 290-4]
MMKRWIWMLGVVAFSAQASGARDAVVRFLGSSERIVKEYPSAPGLAGFVVNPPGGGDPIVLYADIDGKFVLAGAVFSPDGKNLTASELDVQLPKPDLSAMLGEAQSTRYVETGDPRAAKTLYIVAEPNCGYCRKAYEALKDYQQVVKVRWIFIGFNEEGEGKARAAIAAGNGNAALASIYGDGGILAPNASVRLDENEAFAGKWGIRGTPYLIYQSASGQVKARPGLLSGAALASLIADAG